MAKKYFINMNKINKECRVPFISVFFEKAISFAIYFIEENDHLLLLLKEKYGQTTTISFDAWKGIEGGIQVTGSIIPEIKSFILDNYRMLWSYDLINGKDIIFHMGDYEDCILDFSIIDNLELYPLGLFMELFEEIEQNNDNKFVVVPFNKDDLNEIILGISPSNLDDTL